ncbi:cell division GTPase FtsZ [Flavobacterium sp. 7A]|nr:cell division GTPase FtsZ [Flavobacterium sp. 7A]
MDQTRLEAFKKVQEKWEQRTLIDSHLIPADAINSHLIIQHATDKVFSIRIFNNQESLNLGCLVVPEQFDLINTEALFLAEIENSKSQFDSLILICAKATFSDIGFNEIIYHDDAITQYRNTSFDFENFKTLFENCPIALLRTNVASNHDTVMDAITPIFNFPESSKSYNTNFGNALLCISNGMRRFTKIEVNDVVKYSLSKITRGASLCHSTLQDDSLEKEIKIGVLLGVTNGFK